MSLKDMEQNDEAYRQYRRMDQEYEMAMNKMSFENSVLTPREEQAIKQAIWEERDVPSVEEDICNLGNFEHEIPMREFKRCLTIYNDGILITTSTFEKIRGNASENAECFQSKWIDNTN